MHTLIVCGTPWCNTAYIQTALEAAGMRPAKEAASGSVTTPAVWHDRLFAGQTQGQTQGPATRPAHALQPGKAWEMAASEIFLANWDQPLWGWADHRSTWLLDFWHQFDPQTRFVLVHTPAAQVLAQAAAHSEGGAFNPHAVLQTWCEHQRQMLQFFHRHRDRCAWVLNHPQAQPAQWLPTLPAEWGLQPAALLRQPQPAVLAQPAPSLLHLLAQQAVQQHEQALALQNEIQATLPPDTPWPADIATAAQPLDAAAALAQVNQLAHSQRQHAALAAAQAQALHSAEQESGQLALQLQQAQALLDYTLAQAKHLQQQQEAADQHRADLSRQLQHEAQARQALEAQWAAETAARTEHARQLGAQLHAAQAQAEQLAQNCASLASARDAQAQASADLQARLDAAAQAHAELHQKLQHEAQARQGLAAQLAAENQAKADLQTQLSAETLAKKEALEESELLLTQLHQVQEELEKIFLESASLQKQHAADAQARAELQKRLDAEAKAKAEAQQKLQQEAQARQALAAQLAAETKAKAEQARQLGAQLQAAQAQAAQLGKDQTTLSSSKEAEAKAKAELQKRLDAEAKAKADLQAQLDAEAKAKAEAQQKLQQEAQARQGLAAQLAAETRARQESTEESELLLTQLLQVQEELERYFLQHQQAQQDNQQLQTRLGQWAQRYPDHCEWDSLAVLPHTQANQQTVLISALQNGGRALGQVHLGLQHSKKQHTLLLTRQPGQPLPLLSWPHGGDGSDGNAAEPVAEWALPLSAARGTPGAEALARLAPTDLNLLKATCKAIATSLPANTPQHQVWAGHWQAAASALDHLPTTWRYDSLSLRHEQVNPDYEHLWLRFANAQYGDRRWAEFEFRLSASNVRKNQFSKLPKLEFPLPDNNGPKQFENWFEESEDDKGPKFELRFDIKAPAMDIACWNALNAQDQAQATELIVQLPRFLHQLEAAGTRIHRPWADWHTLATGIQHALAVCLNLTPLAALRHEPAAAAAV